MRIALAAALLALTVTRAASAEQFVLVDADYVHTTESHAYAKPSAGIPSNWRTPVNYAEGTAYYRLEVLEKPSDENLNMGVCFVGSSYCCFGYQRFTKVGVYEWSMAIPTMWQYDAVDFTKPMTEIPFIMRDRNAVKVDPGVESFFGAPSTALYFPMKSHLTITVVSKGGTLAKPDAGPPDVKPDAPDVGAATDARTDDTSAADTATPVADTATPLDAVAVDTSEPASDAAEPVPEATSDEALEGSCAMGRSTGASPLAFFGALAIAGTRRRRARPAPEPVH